MKKRLRDITAVVNHKGGVGKTSTVLSLAGGLLRGSRGQARVLVIDTDPQCNLSLLCGWDVQNPERKPTVYDALCEDGEGRGLPVYRSERGIYYAPAARTLQKVDRELHNQPRPLEVLWNRMSEQLDDHTGSGLTTIEESFDYVFIDCPPALSDTTRNAMIVASVVLIPVQLEPLSINGLAPILVEQDRLERQVRQKLTTPDKYQEQDTCIVPVMVEGNTKICRGYHQYLIDSFGSVLTDSIIRKDVRMKESQAQYKDIFEYAPYSRAAIGYENLIKELYLQS